MLAKIYIVSFLISVFSPDLYIPWLLRRYKKRVGINDENKNLYWLPKRLGWFERALYWFVWFIFKGEFIIFIGIWLALKVVGNYIGWQKADGEHEVHKARARAIIFMIGTALSIISVISICLFTEFTIKSQIPHPNPFNQLNF